MLLYSGGERYQGEHLNDPRVHTCADCVFLELLTLLILKTVENEVIYKSYPKTIVVSFARPNAGSTNWCLLLSISKLE